MKTRIDLKSALCGLLVGVVAVLAIGAAGESSNQIGRYQSSAAAELVLIVDTVTGQAWCVRPGGQSTSTERADFYGKKLGK